MPSMLFLTTRLYHGVTSSFFSHHTCHAVNTESVCLLYRTNDKYRIDGISRQVDNSMVPSIERGIVSGSIIPRKNRNSKIFNDTIKLPVVRNEMNILYGRCGSLTKNPGNRNCVYGGKFKTSAFHRWDKSKHSISVAMLIHQEGPEIHRKRQGWSGIEESLNKNVCCSNFTVFLLHKIRFLTIHPRICQETQKKTRYLLESASLNFGRSRRIMN